MRRSDAQDFYEIVKDPALYSFTKQTPPEFMAIVERLLFWELMRSPDGTEIWINLMVRLKSDGRAIGHVQATIVKQFAFLAWVIRTEFQGQGYAKEAATAFFGLMQCPPIEKVYANIHPDHLASQAVARHLGLHPDGSKTEEGEDLWSISLNPDQPV